MGLHIDHSVQVLDLVMSTATRCTVSNTTKLALMLKIPSFRLQHLLNILCNPVLVLELGNSSTE